MGWEVFGASGVSAGRAWGFGVDTGGGQLAG